MGVSVETTDCVHRIEYLKQTKAQVKFLSLEPLLGPLPNLDLRGIEWVVGGESGPGARPMAEERVLDIRDQRLAKFPFSSSSGGGFHRKRAGRLLQERTWDQLPPFGAEIRS